MRQVFFHGFLILVLFAALYYTNAIGLVLWSIVSWWTIDRSVCLMFEMIDGYVCTVHTYSLPWLPDASDRRPFVRSPTPYDRCLINGYVFDRLLVASARCICLPPPRDRIRLTELVFASACAVPKANVVLLNIGGLMNCRTWRIGLLILIKYWSMLAGHALDSYSIFIKKINTRINYLLGRKKIIQISRSLTIFTRRCVAKT